MAKPDDDREELQREMEMIEREGGGPGESAPLRRLALLGGAVVLLVLAYLIFVR